MNRQTQQTTDRTDIEMPVAGVVLRGILRIPEAAEAIVIFAHGAGSSRLSPRNQHVADVLHRTGLATLLMDLMTEEEERTDMATRRLAFDIPFLARRVVLATDWLLSTEVTQGLKIGYFGASTGAAAALKASVYRPKTVGAVVSRGGRPDLAEDVLGQVDAPTLLIIGAKDEVVLRLNRQAAEVLGAEHKLIVIPGATHLFEEPGKLDAVADHAAHWFSRYLCR